MLVSCNSLHWVSWGKCYIRIGWKTLGLIGFVWIEFDEAGKLIKKVMEC